MNYDPIHDTYLPAAEAKSGTGDHESIKPQISDNTLKPDTEAPNTSLHGTRGLVASTSSPGRPQSNLHQLLHNLSNIAENNSHDKATAPERSSEGHLLFVHPGAGQNASLSGLVDNAIVPNTSQSDLSSLKNKRKWSLRDEAASLTEMSGHNNSQRSPNSNLSAPVKDSKLIINNLVASNSNDDQVGEAFGNSYNTNTQRAKSDLGDQEQRATLEHSVRELDSDSLISEREVPLGSLPSNFRSASKGFKHLKKPDGEPFWRRDIQYDFLNELFSDKLRVFTNYFPHSDINNAVNGPKLTFAELYVRTLAESSKSSRILSERLIRDSEVGISVSKVCLLVNAGRMNTTVNFVPDMKSALRTYHLIPSLQATAHGLSKPLQDTPRLKTILKAVCDGQDHWKTLLDIIRAPAGEKPNTNIIKLIFLMSSFFQNIPFHYDDSASSDIISSSNDNFRSSTGSQNRFMEFFLNDEMHPQNRARRFLWLMYTYMETSFTQVELDNNPFHAKCIPPVVYVTKEETGTFDKDTDYEIAYATEMYHIRMMHLSEDNSGSHDLKKVNKAKSDKESVKSQSPSKSVKTNAGSIENDSADELASVEESLIKDDFDDEEIVEPSHDSTKVCMGSDKLKRKKPTPSVGSLVEENRKSSDIQPQWHNPKFPLANLRDLRNRFSICSKQAGVARLERHSPLSNSRKKEATQQSRSIIAHMVKTVPNFDARRKEITQWMYRYFQYRKSNGNGLLTMEWEDIRHELINGIETYLYQQLGKVFITHNYDEQIGEERHDNGDPELLRRENFITVSDHLPGDSAPIDVGDIGSLGSGFSPSHDFDRANERTTYEYLLLQMAEEIISNSYRLKGLRSELFHFDLESEQLLFS